MRPDADGYFGSDVAARYDDPDSEMFEPAVVGATVDVLAALAGDGRALELGIGTGRVALPLAARGVPVHGVDLSRAMVERMRAKPGGDRIEVTICDFATTRVAGQLAPGGRFVIEVMVPELRRLPHGQTVVPFEVGPAGWAYDVYDVATQRTTSNYVTVVDGVGSYRAIPFRYVWPSELDLMAQLAGLRLVERWDGWHRAPFTHESRQHVSVWEKPV